MSLLESFPSSNAVSAAAVSLRIVDGEEQKAEELPPILQADEAVAAAIAAAHSQPRKASTRQPIVFTDAQGQERTYGSALGALTRKFIDIVQHSRCGSVDMNETANLLQVPKRRIYDITNVLEGVGVLERRSKNTVAWKGSESILGALIEPEAKEHIGSLRTEIGEYLQEETLLDQWISHLSKMTTPNSFISVSDIIQAYFYPSGSETGRPFKDDLLETNGTRPKQSLLAIHAPYDSVVQIPMPEYDGQADRQLFVGTKDALGDHNKKRKLAYDGRIGPSKSARAGQPIQVYVLSTYFDESSQTIAPAEVKLLVDNERRSSWDLAESLANDEGVSDFCGTGDEEAV